MKSMSKFGRLYSVFVVLVFITAGVAVSGVSVYAEVFRPVIVEPYDQNSLKRLEKSYVSLETNLGKLGNAGRSLETVAKAFEDNPTEENKAAFVEKVGKASQVSIEVLNNSIKLLDVIQPEINSYKEYLKKLKRDMHMFSDNPLYEEFSSEHKKEIDGLDEFIKELEMVKKDLKEAREVIAAETNVWLANKNIEATLTQLIPNGNMGKFFKGLTQFFKPLIKIKDIINKDIKRGGLHLHADYENEKDEYKEATNNFFGRL
jgi:hypothetical protein